jgi:hypothetical protein
MADLGIGETAILQNLKHHVEHVGVGLLDLIKQHHSVRPAAHSLSTTNTASSQSNAV